MEYFCLYQSTRAQLASANDHFAHAGLPVIWLERWMAITPRMFFCISIAVLLLFPVLRQMTDALWKSAIVAALFAIHPLHVESVAWVSERKDVLSAVFFFLMLGAVHALCAVPIHMRYLLVTVLFAGGTHGQVNVGNCASRFAPSRLLAA